MPAAFQQPFLAFSFDPIDETCPLPFPALGLIRLARESLPSSSPAIGQTEGLPAAIDAEHGTGGGAIHPVVSCPVNAPRHLSPVADAHAPQGPAIASVTGDLLPTCLLADLATQRARQLARGHTPASDAADFRDVARHARVNLSALHDHLFSQRPANCPQEGAADRAMLNKAARRDAVRLAACAIAIIQALDFLDAPSPLPPAGGAGGGPLQKGTAA